MAGRPPSCLLDVLASTLLDDPEERLDGEGVRQLPFFADHIPDWSVVERLGLKPPYVPKFNGRLKKTSKDFMRGRDSMPRLKSVKGKEVDLSYQPNFDFAAEYCGYFHHHHEGDRGETADVVTVRGAEGGGACALTHSQQNLQALLSQHNEEAAILPSDCEGDCNPFDLQTGTASHG